MPRRHKISIQIPAAQTHEWYIRWRGGTIDGASGIGQVDRPTDGSLVTGEAQLRNSVAPAL